MKVKQLIARLSELDPEQDIYRMDGEYGPEPVETIAKEMGVVETARGRTLPAPIWVIE